MPTTIINDLGLQTITGMTMPELNQTSVELGLIANEIYDLEGHKSAVFAKPAAAAITEKLITEAESCGYTITCGVAEAFTVSLTKELIVAEAIRKCPVAALSPDFLRSKYVNTVKRWNKTIVGDALVTLEAAATPFTPSASALNKQQAIEEAIVQFRNEGYQRSDLTVAVNAQTASDLAALKFDCCTLTTSPFEASANKFGVAAVVDVGNQIDSDFVVYIKDYLLIGNSCANEPAVFDGLPATEWYGWSIVQGSVYTGNFYFNPDGKTALKYSEGA